MYDFKALYEAQSVRNAVELMLEHPEARLIAGGSDLLIRMREGKLRGCEIISIFSLDELRGVTLDGDGAIRILPLTSFSHITRDPIIQKNIRVLGEATDQVGGPQIRNIGTIGGNVCNGATSADSASTLLAWDAVLEITGPEGTRKTPIGEFYLAPGKVALGKAEILTAILIPEESYRACFGNYIKYSLRNAMDIATLGCSANVRLSADGRIIERARIAYGVAAPTPIRAGSAEAAASGQPVSGETIELVGNAVLKDISPRTSWRASKELREHLAKELAKRALTEAIRRAGGEI